MGGWEQMSSLHLQRRGERREGGEEGKREREIKSKRRNKIQRECKKNSGICCGIRIDII